MTADALIQKLLAHRFPAHMTDSEAIMHNGAMDDAVLIVKEHAAEQAALAQSSGGSASDEQPLYTLTPDGMLVANRDYTPSAGDTVMVDAQGNVRFMATSQERVHETVDSGTHQPDELITPEQMDAEDNDPVADAYAKGYADGYKAKAIATEREAVNQQLTRALVANDALLRDIRHRDARWRDDEAVRQVLDANKVLFNRI